MRIGQTGAYRLLTEFEFFGFEARPAAFGLGRTRLGVAVAVAPPAQRPHNLVLVEQGLIGSSAALAALVLRNKV